MIIAPARAGDIATIMAWRRERTAWLAAQGQDQWSIPLPRTAVAATVLAGQTWMVWDGPDPAATITLTAFTGLEELWKPDKDPEALWRAADRPDDALYAAKMIVPIARSSQDLGKEMLDWAGGRAFEAGLTWLRLDAWTTNTRLHDYYQQAGFHHIRTITSRISGACFQRAAQPYLGGRLKLEE